MDHADAVAYSVHDVDDFYRAGLIPLELVPVEFKDHLDDFKKQKKLDITLIEKHESALAGFIKLLPFRQRYTGTPRERGLLRGTTSYIINDFVTSVGLQRKNGRIMLEVPGEAPVQMGFLQRLLWRYVIENPRLATQQRGQREIIRYLFNTYKDAIENPKQRALIPPMFSAQLLDIDKPKSGTHRPSSCGYRGKPHGCSGRQIVPAVARH
jgi:dGTPase